MERLWELSRVRHTHAERLWEGLGDPAKLVSQDTQDHRHQAGQVQQRECCTVDRQDGGWRQDLHGGTAAPAGRQSLPLSLACFLSVCCPHSAMQSYSSHVGSKNTEKQSRSHTPGAVLSQTPPGAAPGSTAAAAAARTTPSAAARPAPPPPAATLHGWPAGGCRAQVSAVTRGPARHTTTAHHSTAHTAPWTSPPHTHTRSKHPNLHRLMLPPQQTCSACRAQSM